MSKILPFWGMSHICSNFHPAWFYYGGVWYPTVEHAMMMEKAYLFRDDTAIRAIEQLIETVPHEPWRAKYAGRRVQGFDPDHWDSVRRDIVYRRKLAQAIQVPHIAHFYIENSDRTFVEASPTDLIWGVGLLSTDPRIQDPKQWRGKNLLGEICTQIASWGEELEMIRLQEVMEFYPGGELEPSTPTALRHSTPEALVKEFGIDLTTAYPVHRPPTSGNVWQVVRFMGKELLYPARVPRRYDHYIDRLYVAKRPLQFPLETPYAVL